MDSLRGRKTVKILISWLHEKPADQYLHCFFCVFEKVLNFE